MFLRMISLTLVMMFLIQPVTASETTRQGLKTIYDEYHYALTVEWDQKDKTFAKTAEAKFKDQLEELQKQGLTSEELIEFASTQFKDEKVKADFNNLLTMMKVTSMKPSEVNKMVNDILKTSYQRGASWSGQISPEAIAGIIVGAVILAIIVAVAVSCSKGGCTGGGGSSSSDDSDWSDDDSWDDDWSDDWCTETYVCDYYYDEYGEWEDCYYECW